MKRIKVIGITRDFNQCDCCGKTDLLQTVSILDIETEVILHYGTTCASSADKYDTLEAHKEAKKEINKTIRDFQNLVNSCKHIAWKNLYKVYKNNIPQDIFNNEFELIMKKNIEFRNSLKK